MKPACSVCSLLTLLLLCACTSTKPIADAKSRSSQMAQTFHFKKTQQLNVGYLLYLPKNYGAPDKKWPLLLFLHGSGERGTDIWKVAAHGPPRNVTNQTDFPFIVVSPQCPEGQVWSNDPLLGLLDDITARYAVDTTRVYLTGLSMGGYGAWSLGTTHPERFAALAPICGG